MDIVKEYLKYLWKEIIYIVLVTVYLILLNNLNSILLSKRITNDFELLQYNGGQPIKYFVFAIILFAIGIMLIFSRIKQLKQSGSLELEINDIREVVVLFLSIFILLIVLILIFHYIQIPILKAILGVVGVAIGIFYAISN